MVERVDAKHNCFIWIGEKKPPIEWKLLVETYFVFFYWAITTMSTAGFVLLLKLSIATYFSLTSQTS